jgi:hypothetical protein
MLLSSKSTDLKNLGLADWNALKLVLSHVDSAPVEKMGDKRPLDVAYFMYHDLYEKLTAFGLQKKEKDKVILNLIFPKINQSQAAVRASYNIILKWKLVLHHQKLD